MRLLELSFDRPSENLAMDEVLLDSAESGRSTEILRLWESQSVFAVLGCSQAVRQEVNEAACREDHVQVLRRCSAGGCVLQGPGCINYSLILAHNQRPPDLRTVRASYCYILGQLCDSFARHGVTVKHKGVSDLAVGGQKVSGCAQKRRQRCILHHGTFLYDMDPALMERYLREPADRPQYRGDRTHLGFVRMMPISRDSIRMAIVEAFGMNGKPGHLDKRELEAMQTLAKEKYQSRDWNYRR